ncbi:MAG: hypothetical protein C4527_19910 [Candidatus Omnitrophota bacterium]|jgi:hypothetical protein|nr:MAG: hypothetical protein C4527_19910 [Candidatus Omnitrophota bacterium]
MNKELLDIQMFKPSDINLEVAAWVILLCAALILFIFLAYKRYLRFKKEQELLEELVVREFESVESSTITDLVKRYTVNEPIEILYSLRLFDELAEKEMTRVLGSALSSESKTQYVDMLYRIRQKTYFPSEFSFHAASDLKES